MSAKQLHHVCAVDERGTTVFSRTVRNRQGAIEDLVSRARVKAGSAVGELGEVVWGWT